MRIILIFIVSLLLNISTQAAVNRANESYEAIRARVKIKFTLDPILSKEKITLQHQNGQLTLVGQVSNPIVEEQALYLVHQSTPKADAIKNELIVEKNTMTPRQTKALIELAAKARLEAAAKYQLKDIPFIGMTLHYNQGTLLVSGAMNNRQKSEIRNALKNFKQIKDIQFSSTPTTRNLINP